MEATVDLEYNFEKSIVTTRNPSLKLKKILNTVNSKEVPEKMGGPGKLYITVFKISMEELTEFITE